MFYSILLVICMFIPFVLWACYQDRRDEKKHKLMIHKAECIDISAITSAKYFSICYGRHSYYNYAFCYVICLYDGELIEDICFSEKIPMLDAYMKLVRGIGLIEVKHSEDPYIIIDNMRIKKGVI